MNLGIPYMGSKRKLAPDILKLITSRHSGITDFYDLFGGGGSISFNAIKDYRFNVHYNELNRHIYHLVKYLKENKELEPKFYEWVTREVFFEQLDREDADWYSGFVMSCWSFGNNSEKGYMYGADIEEIKRWAHQFVVFGCLDSMHALKINIPELCSIKDVQKRRIYFCDYIQKTNKERFDIQNLERFVQLERIQNLQNLQNLQITNFSYKNVIITGKNPVIYCDIPYKGTGEYKEGGFNHERFYQWANDCQYPVYISEYDAPFEEVESFTHRSSLSATNNKKKTIEKIFWNGKGIINQTKLF
ncbi:MAG: DNA adenine methylase [Pedobacter sp.]|jgi:site-specific DNA-adenine methylase